MGNEIDVGNIIAGFGGVFVVGLIGIAVHLYLGHRERKAQERSNSVGRTTAPR